jgi:hypothetical protein
VADKKAVEASFSAYKQEVVVATRKKRLEALVNSGRVTPAESAQCLNYAQAMAASADITMDFAAADGKSEKLSVEEHYWRSLEAREPSPLMAPLQAPKEQQQEVKTINTAKL